VADNHAHAFDNIRHIVCPWLGRARNRPCRRPRLRTHASRRIGALRAAEYLPRMFIGPLAGVWVDRLRRRPVLIITDLLRALLLLSVAAAAGLGMLRVELLYAAALVMAALDVVFNTALVAHLPSLVRPVQLVAANAARATSSAATEVVGRSLAGILFQTIGPSLAVGLSTVCRFSRQQSE